MPASLSLPVLPTTQRALLASLPPAHAPDSAPWRLAPSHPVPALGAGEVRVRTTHAALNPFDWQGVAYRFALGPEVKAMGRDGAGVVVGLGAGVTRFRLGDRVWFCANSASGTTGAFQEFSVHAAAEVAHTPGGLSDAEAATLPTGLVTAGVVLFRTLGLPLDDLARVAGFTSAASAPSVASASSLARADAPWLLVWGAAGSTGASLVSLAHLLGYRVVCAASPASHARARARGADVVVDRTRPPAELVDAVRAATGDDVRLAVDTVGPTTAALCRAVLAGSAAWRAAHGLPPPDGRGARLVAIAGAPPADAAAADAVRAVDTPRLSFSTTFFSHPQFSAPFLDVCTALLEQGRLRPASVQHHPGGLAGVAAGLDELRLGNVKSGSKLVVRLSDGAPAAVSSERLVAQDRRGDVQVGELHRPMAIAV